MCWSPPREVGRDREVWGSNSRAYGDLGLVPDGRDPGVPAGPVQVRKVVGRPAVESAAVASPAAPEGPG